ncbi:MAG: N-acyl homoserine lactonase family protein [Chloroflexi bacterium]|nr:N-acyl homoserine lactonase family protein [Chloroflexota bacterium]
MSISESIPQRLYLMQLSTSTIPLPEGQQLDMVCVCYLIETSDGKHILIDTGLPPDIKMPAPAENEKNVVEHLAELDLHPADIDILICTHFDIDHVGYHELFTQAELVVQRHHYELAQQGHPRFATTQSHWNHPDLHYRLIDGDFELLPGITLIETSGHAPGHQSVLVRLPQTGPVLLAIDAVVFQRLFNTNRQAWPTDDNEGQLRASSQKLLDLVEREGVQFVVFGHDGGQWATLKKSPAYYE